MATAVRADEIVVGDVVVLPTASGDQELQIHRVTVRAETIKFVGRTPATPQRRQGGETDWGWGWPPDRTVQRVRRAGE